MGVNDGQTANIISKTQKERLCGEMCIFVCQVKSKSMPHHQNSIGINKDKSPSVGGQSH